MRSTALLACLACLALPALALADHAANSQFSRRHSDLAKRGSAPLEKRFDNARFSYYDITTGQYVLPSIINSNVPTGF
jgi:hypothetical protein